MNLSSRYIRLFLKSGINGRKICELTRRVANKPQVRPGGLHTSSITLIPRGQHYQHTITETQDSQIMDEGKRDDWGGGGRWSSGSDSDQDSGSRDQYSGGRSNRWPGDWDCPSCQFSNFASRSMCFKCRTPKDADGLGSGGRVGGGMREMRPGDWSCPKCRFHNFSFRDMCGKCNSPREDGQSGGGGGGGGMDGGRNNMRPGDWECNNCQFHNFASRDQCFKCSSPKYKDQENIEDMQEDDNEGQESPPPQTLQQTKPKTQDLSMLLSACDDIEEKMLLIESNHDDCNRMLGLLNKIRNHYQKLLAYDSPGY